MINTVLVGAVTAILNLNPQTLEEVLRERFDKMDVAESNIKAARSGYNYVKHSHPGAVKYNLEERRDESLKLVMNGNEAIGLGAIAAGCTFMAAYPMTPSTPILEYFASKAEELGLVFIQAEDEIAAVNMAVGASFAGARAMTATSGSGFCLMVEGYGLAALTETPLVIVDGQRPGPCVGLPTRTEQGDLSFVLTAHHGDFPRVVLAPASVEDAFWLTVKAFNLADRFQTPVIILNDQHLGESYTTVEPFDMGEVFIDRGELLSEQESDRAARTYLRHRVTPSGISPRAFPGRGKALVVTDSDEHDEAGHLTESAAERTAQVLKRLRKEDGLVCDIIRPRWYGSGNPAVSLLGWGSSLGALMETVDALKEQGMEANLLHFSQLWPFPRAEAADFLKEARRSIVVESNATGQLRKLISQETGIVPGEFVRRFDGRPLTPAFILKELEKAI
jgi:2-oxoglutarate ferredoxin oxidoreductase subunit alpha